jgi:hypothetical protein
VTGQSNSLLSDYKNADLISKLHREILVRTSREVEVVTIGSYVNSHGLKQDFLKIDVEGCEYEVLLGATLVEVTMQHDAVTKLLHNANFSMLGEHKNKLETIIEDGNVFALQTAQFPDYF